MFSYTGDSGQIEYYTKSLYILKYIVKYIIVVEIRYYTWSLWLHT